MPILHQQNKTPPLPDATWGICILAVWNKAARMQLITNNPSWLKKRKQDLSPAAILKFKNAGTIPFLGSSTERILSRMAKYVGSQTTQETQLSLQTLAWPPIRTARSPPIMHVQQKRVLQLKASNWREWDLTDGSCIANKWMSVYWAGM